MEWKPQVPFPVFRKQWAKRYHSPETWDAIANHEDYALEAALLQSKKTIQQKAKEERTAGETISPAIEDWVEFLCVRENVRTFLFSKPLLESLDATDPYPIPAELVKIPFDVIYLDFSALPIDISVFGIDPTPMFMRGVFLASAEQAGTGLLTLGLKANTLPRDEWLQKYLGAYLQAERRGGAEHPGGIVATTVSCIGERYSAAVSAQEARPWGLGRTIFSPKDGKFMIDRLPALPATAEEVAVGYTLLKRAFNGLLYINSVNADIREEWMREDLVSHLKGKSGKARRDLKASIEREGKVHRAGYYISIPSVSPPSDPLNPGKTLDVRFLVRGHNHHYWTGSDRRGTKKLVLRWLAPYWKGPEMAEVVHKTYVVKPKKEE